MIDVLEVLGYFGIIVFAVSGALVAARARMDLVGFALIGIITGVGGGTLRDVVLGRFPVFWVEQPRYLVLCMAAAVLTFFCVPFISSRLKVLLWADAAGLAVFSVLGTEAAHAAGAPLIVAALLGVASATFGGIFRDILCQEPSLILLKEIYITAALAGALLYVSLIELAVAPTVAVIAGCIGTFLVRGVALMYGLSLPAFVHPHDRPGAAGPTPRTSDTGESS